MKFLFIVTILFISYLPLSFAEPVDFPTSINVNIPQLDEIKDEIKEANSNNDNWNKVSYIISLTAITAAGFTVAYTRRQTKAM